MKRVTLAALFLINGCAHNDISVNAGTSLAPPSASGTGVVSSGVGLQVNASGGVAAALAAGLVVAATLHDLRDPQPAPYTRSFSDWLWAGRRRRWIRGAR